MCGIVGVFTNKNKGPYITYLQNISQSRGKDSSGIACIYPEKIKVYKKSEKASVFTKNNLYKKLVTEESLLGVIGHARMETDGTYFNDFNNQPIVKDGIALIHNGIIVNHQNIWDENKDLKREFDVDTEIINSLLRKNINDADDENNIANAVNNTVSVLKGAYSIGGIFEDLDLVLLASNTGSLYFIHDKDRGFLIFASEKYFLNKFINKFSFFKSQIKQVKPGDSYLFSIKTYKLLDLKGTKKAEKNRFTVNRPIELVSDNKKTKSAKKKNISFNKSEAKQMEKLVFEQYNKSKEKIDNLRRCTKCLLPETMPFIEFDKDGVCNFCHNYHKAEYKGEKELGELLSKYKRSDGKPDCLVTFSGGRDSSYCLHYVKKGLGMNPVAYSYDWGMITDLARRNQARMTGDLEVEHILVSADIQKKRENIRKNVLAWLRNPQLGTVPLFMAGDKQFFYYANKIRDQLGVDIIIVGGNLLEKTDFKSGFCGIKPTSFQENKKFYSLSATKSLSMFSYYASQIIKNPTLINSSIIDTMTAFGSYYFIPHEHIPFYYYLEWDFDKIHEVLKKYDWETDPETSTTWRIGDGTAGFYNYIYYVLAGFTENDTFLSNLVREGQIDRKTALEMANDHNQPRIESLLWYFEKINISPEYPIKKINASRKLY